MNFNINKQPQEIRQKIKKHMNKINSLNSTQLLEYSKNPTLKRCIADNHIELVGENFFCANWEVKK